MEIEPSRLPKAEEITTLDQAREVIALQAAIIEHLLQQVKQLQEQVEELNAKLAKNSRNSHKPPSSDVDHNKPKPKSRRKKSNRPTGGQRGHRGHTLNQVDDPQQRRLHTLTHCPQCGRSLNAVAVQAHERRQVFDVELGQRQVTEHRAEIKVCPYCQARVKAEFPQGVEHPVQYGAQAKGLVGYFSQYQLMPYQRLQEVFRDLLHLPISQGSVKNILAQGYGQLEEFEGQVKAQLIASSVVNFDETGTRINQTKHWIHVASTATLTYYYIHRKRGREAMDAAGILPQFTGRAIHDHWSSYYGYCCDHGLCNAHLLRELIYAEEQYGQRWAARLQDCLLDAKAEVDTAKGRGKRALSRARINYYQRRYSRILCEGKDELPGLDPPATAPKSGRPKQHKAKNLHDRLKAYKFEALAFLYDFDVPFDNNQAERDIRMTKVKQKVSGCFRSEQGAASFSRIRSYISTAKKQGKNILDVLVSVFQGNPFLPQKT